MSRLIKRLDTQIPDYPQFEYKISLNPDQSSFYCTNPNDDFICQPYSWTTNVGKGSYNVTVYLYDDKYNQTANLQLNDRIIVNNKFILRGELKIFSVSLTDNNGFINLFSKCKINCEKALTTIVGIKISPSFTTTELASGEIELDCGSFIGGRCYLKNTPTNDLKNCIYDNKNEENAKLCEKQNSNYALVKIVNTQCFDQIGLFKCVMINHFSLTDCMAHCPNYTDCDGRKCNTAASARGTFS